MSLGPPPYPIINESTSVVQVNSSGLQAGQAALVYVSSSATPGLFVTVRDATGHISTPQTILLSTVGATRFADSSFSTLITQGFGTKSLYAVQPNLWTVVNQDSFLDPTAVAQRRTLDAKQIRTSTLLVQDMLSSVHTQAVGAAAFTSYDHSQVLYTSSIYVGPTTLSSYYTSVPGDPRALIGGSLKIFGSTVTNGSLFARDEVFIGTDFFAGGQNISSRNGVIMLGGNMTTLSSLRCQRGPSSGTLFTGYLDINGPSSIFGGTVTVPSTVRVDDAVNTRQTSTSFLTVSSASAASSVQFTTNGFLRVDPTAITFVNLPLTTASLSTASIINTSSMTTSNLTTQNLLSSSSLSSILFSSATIQNPSGSASLFSTQVDTIDANPTPSVTPAATATAAQTNTLSMNGASWLISSIAPTANLIAPTAAAQALQTTTTTTTVSTLSEASITTSTVAASSVTITNALHFASSGLFTPSFQAQYTTLLLQQGGISGSVAATATQLQASTIKTATISSPTAIVFPSALSSYLSSATVQTLSSHTPTTSSLTLYSAIISNPLNYSTINPSTPWMLTSSSGLNSPPFSQTTGIGTPFTPVEYTAIQSSLATYTIITPLSQFPQTLSTPYVNTIAGTGSAGGSNDGSLATQASIGEVQGQPTLSPQGTIFFGTNFEGWKVKRIGTNGIITTVAGRSQTFYGDRGNATAAALSPHTFVSVAGSNTVLITDSSNNRIRYVYPSTATISIISTIAGYDQKGYAGDGGQAPQAKLLYPAGTAVDSSGSYYIADLGNHIIRKVAPTGIITTIAGIPATPGYSGDGGQATAARLHFPSAVAIDTGNNVYISDTSNNVIRRVIAENGLITTFAGTGISGYSGDGGAATAATLRAPAGLAFDPSGNLFIADVSNNVIRRVDAATNIITTVAGAGSQGYSGNGGPATGAQMDMPLGVTVNSSNRDLYIADTQNHVIRRVSSGTGIIYAAAGTSVPGFSGDGGVPTSARISTPTTVAFDAASQRYFFSDEGNSRIRFVNLLTNRIATYAGNGSPFTAGNGGPASNAMFQTITGVVADSSSNLFVVEAAGNQIRRIAANTCTITAYAGTRTAGYGGDGGLATAALLNQPHTAVLDSARNLYFTDELNSRLRKVDATTGRITTLAGDGSFQYNGDGVIASTTALNYPRALTLDSASNLYIGDTSNFRVRRVDATTGIINTYLGAGYQDPVIGGLSSLATPIQTVTAISFDSKQQLYFTELETNRLWVISTNSTVQAVSATNPAIPYRGDAGPVSSAYFSWPTGLLVDSSDNLLICDNCNFRLRRTYTVGQPQLPTYLTLNFTYTNFSTTAGSASIGINGSTVKTFSAATSSNDTYSLSNANVWDYPLLSSNPANGSQLPYITILQNSAGYTQLQGRMYAEQTPNQDTGVSYLNREAGIFMNFGRMEFPIALDGVTIENRYNDASTRSLFYTDSLVNASDPALKDVAGVADLARCREAVEAIPLRRFAYNAAYRSTFQVQDHHRLGILTTEVARRFPKSVERVVADDAAAEHDTVELGQLKWAHLGLTKYLQATVSTLEAAVAALQQP